MDLFEHRHARKFEKEQPLAARMRPRTLDEFFGQQHILAPGRLLRRAIQADQLSSLIFYGPPGTGKTTLAAVVANTTKSHFEVLNAVLAGVADIRRVTEQAKRRIVEHERRTILFVDEVHRWNKAQQDALLPWVENGNVILIGATTENPYFTVNRALVSRSRIFQLKPLAEEDLWQIGEAAIRDPERGYGKLRVECEREALRHIVNIANGDARAVLNALELAVETTAPETDGDIRLTMAVAEESIQRRAVLYDKEGDYHFDTISAFIKSMRGSDPDAAMYWLAKMVYAGEDPRFMLRRMLIFAAEDVGLADPAALGRIEAAADAFDRVGLPEGQYHLAMAALDLATAPKSNSAFAYFDALSTVEKEREGEVPNHLKDGSRDQRGFGHGQGYSYPHAYREHWVAQQYLPDDLQGKLFYRPGKLGYEGKIADTVNRRRETQLAAALAAENQSATAENLTWSPRDRAAERWLNRTLGRAGEQLSTIREKIFEQANCRRHHRILCLNDEGGLLTWEAIRQAPEGGVHTHLKTEAEQRILNSRIAECPPLRTPQIQVCDPRQLFGQLPPDMRFEAILGRALLFNRADRAELLQAIHHCLANQGRLVLAEPISRRSPRLAERLKFPEEDRELAEIFRAVENEIYHNPQDPMVNWDEEQAAAWLAEAGYARITSQILTLPGERHFSRARIEEWFAEAKASATRPGLGRKLGEKLNAEQLAKVKARMLADLAEQTLPWTATHLLIAAGR